MKITIASIQLGGGGGVKGRGMEEGMKGIFLQNETPDCSQLISISFEPNRKMIFFISNYIQGLNLF